MTPDEALAALAETVELVQRTQDPREAGRAVLKLSMQATRASSAFLAQVDGDGLRWVLSQGQDGEPIDVPPRQLPRVAIGVREALDGVADAPPAMTGGRAPRGAVAIKAEAGQPPVHALPLRGSDGAWEGVLGLVPDPTAPIEHGPATDAVLSVLRGVIDPWILSSGDGAARPTAQTAGEGASFKYDYSAFVTQSAKLHAVFKKLDRVIGAKVTVLITGETGTGKELIARALHDNDPVRRSRRFYSQNCGAMPATLLESELFGYMPGAFTGAEKRKLGLFEIASGSTLFLDEIGETSLEMQTRLLRVLQEQEIVPVGSSEPIKIDVRVVAATLRDLEGDIATGRFRQDLYYRLKVVRLHLPPLRDRPEDIPILIDHFLRKAAREMGKRAKVLDRRDPRIMESFARYGWPGNVRELENVIRRLAYLSDDVIGYDTLLEERQLLGQGGSSETRPVRPLEQVVEEVERAEIENALAHTGGNRTRAADLLEINRRSLLRRLKKYGLSSGDE